MIQYIRIETDDSGEIIGAGLGDPCISCVSAYSEVKKKLAAESGLEDSFGTEEHLAAIKSKARLGGLNSGQKYTKDILAKHSGLDLSEAVNKHIAVIQEAAWCRGANAKTDELQNILSVHSGLERENSIGDHIAAIKLKAYNQGYDKGWHDKQADIQKRIKQFEDAIRETIENE